jgi:hypothetical protein
MIRFPGAIRLLTFCFSVRIHLLSICDEILENPRGWDSETICGATAMSNNLRDFGFCFWLNLFREVHLWIVLFCVMLWACLKK